MLCALYVVVASRGRERVTQAERWSRTKAKTAWGGLEAASMLLSF